MLLVYKLYKFTHLELVHANIRTLVLLMKDFSVYQHKLYKAEKCFKIFRYFTNLHWEKKSCVGTQFLLSTHDGITTRDWLLVSMTYRVYD